MVTQQYNLRLGPAVVAITCNNAVSPHQYRLIFMHQISDNRRVKTHVHMAPVDVNGIQLLMQVTACFVALFFPE